MAHLTLQLIEVLQGLDACLVANAIETFDCRLRNEGFADGRIRGSFADLPPVVGHAVTARIHCSAPPAVGGTYVDRTDWWNHILTIPSPRIVVVEDADERPGTGAFLGEVHANILRALGCVAYVTNGSVRDEQRVHAIGFQLFAPTVAVSHAYVHIVDFGEPVSVGGLGVRSGDILFGDRHGLLNIPDGILEQLPAVAARIAVADDEVVALCQSGHFSLEQLRTLVRPLR